MIFYSLLCCVQSDVLNRKIPSLFSTSNKERVGAGSQSRASYHSHIRDFHQRKLLRERSPIQLVGVLQSLQMNKLKKENLAPPHQQIENIL